MEIIVARKAMEKFKRSARSEYPVEEFAVLLGEINQDQVKIKDVYFPVDRKKCSSSGAVQVRLSWFNEAQDQTGLLAIGDIHSHCLTQKERDVQHEPSQSDWDSAYAIYNNGTPQYCVFGICRIMKANSGRLRATIRFWPLPTPVSTRVVEQEEDD